MRLLWGGLLILLLPTLAFAQAKGQVLSIGFNNHYRPDCWTPMLVQLTSQSDTSTDYQIQILQQDLDHDRVIYTQDVALGGNVDGKPQNTENFWVYFKPTPTDHGLADAADSSTNLNTLASQLKVFLCDKNGKQISSLPLTATILSVDPPRSVTDPARSRKLVLFVIGAEDKPFFPDESMMSGIMEDVDAVTVHPADLPSSILGYEGVDAVVWMDADANYLASGTRGPALEALRQWIHQGGHMVVCQPAEAAKIKPFADLLPVAAILQDQWTIPMQDHPALDVLQRIVNAIPDHRAWPESIGSMKIARVPARSDAKVDEWIEWPDGEATRFTPWLARRAEGLGAVTWVAQDLGSPGLTDHLKSNWRYIWDRVFDWNNASDVPELYNPPENLDDPWKANLAVPTLDLGVNLKNNLDLANLAAWFVVIAFVLFVVYFLIAGPGVFLFLSQRKQAHFSWFYFAALAVGATLITALLVKVIVRGPPKLRHLSVVRSAADDPYTFVDSRFGLYIPQDGLKTIALRQTAPRQVSTIAPFSIHPQYIENDAAMPAWSEYEVPVPTAADSDTDSVAIDVPYRSTSKKLQAHWVGQLKSAIEVPIGFPNLKLVAPGDGGYIAGDLINHTGYDLNNIYIAFEAPPVAHWNDVTTRDYTWLIYIPGWKKDEQKNFKEIMRNVNLVNVSGSGGPQPGGEKIAYGRLGRGQMFDHFWQSNPDSLADNINLDLPLLTVFDRIAPWRNYPAESIHRADIFRRGGRELNLSPALSAGELVVCATEADSNGYNTNIPLPIPLTVSDLSVTGPGMTIVQCVLPLDRSEAYAQPSTQPSTQPGLQ